MTYLKAADYEVREIQKPGADWQAARSFVAEHHYSRGCSKTAVYAHGLYRRGDTRLIGVAMWLPPTRVAAESVRRARWKQVLALSRLVVHPDVPTNGATFLMGRSIRLIRRDGRFVSLVTYADEFMGHKGQIYRAANWQFEGTSSGTPRWEDAEGRQVSALATRTRTKAEMIALGYHLVGRFPKHKFVMHLVGNPTNDNAILWFAIAV